MKQNIVCARIKAYFKKHKDGPAKLAAHMNLASIDTAKAWIRTNRVPLWHQDKVIQFLNDKEKEDGTSNDRK